MSLSFLSAFFSLISLVYIIADIQVLPNNIPKEELVIPLLLVLGVHYFVFMHKGKFRRIEKEFKKESKAERRRKGRWVILYVIGSPLLFIAFMFFGIWIKH